ncbi:MAG: DNA-3-methyladenine glycosylase I, partial [Nannocystaceae bacterium]
IGVPKRVVVVDVARKGEEALAARMPKTKSRRSIAATPDHRCLAAMAKAVFQAGFVWRVIENKWDGFEAAFHGFDPARVANLSGAELAALRRDERIVRNGQKIEAVVENARYVLEEAAEHGSFATMVAGWPEDDIVGLWARMKKRGSRLGGDTGPRVLRSVGKPTFVLTRDVVASLVGQGIVDKRPTSKKDLMRVQDAFNTWAAQSGEDLSAISMTLACGVDAAAP